MARELSVAATLYVGFSMAVGLTSIGIAIVDHKRSTARGEKMAYQKSKPLRPLEYLILAGAAYYTLSQTLQIAEDVASGALN